MNTTELKDLLENATPGPWSYSDVTFTSVWGPNTEHIHYTQNGPSAASNARLIALAPQLAAEVIKLREEVDELLAALSYNAQD